MFRKNMDEVIERNISFTKNSAKTGTLLHILGIEGCDGTPIKPLEEWKLPEECHAYLDACIQRDKEKWAIRENLKDDTMPTMKPFFGIAIHTAFVGGKVKFGGNTSYHVPVIESPEELEELSLKEDNMYLKMLLDGMRYLKEKAEKEGFLASLRGGDGPLDIANALRGNDLFMDFYDDDEFVHELLRFSVKAAKWTWQHQMEVIDPLDGGMVSGQAIWLPGNSIGHLSEDTSSMCSRDVYDEFGRPYTEELLEPYDCTIVHVHTKARHALPAIASMEKVRFLQFEYDPIEPSPIEVYRENEAVLKDKIVVPIMTTDEIEKNLDFLSKHKQIIQLYAKSMDDAQRAVDLVSSLR